MCRRTEASVCRLQACSCRPWRCCPRCPAAAFPQPAVGALRLPAAALPSSPAALPSPAAALPSPAAALPSPAAALPSPVSALPSPVSALPSPVSALPQAARQRAAASPQAARAAGPPLPRRKQTWSADRWPTERRAGVSYPGLSLHSGAPDGAALCFCILDGRIWHLVAILRKNYGELHANGALPCRWRQISSITAFLSSESRNITASATSAALMRPSGERSGRATLAMSV